MITYRGYTIKETDTIKPLYSVYVGNRVVGFGYSSVEVAKNAIDTRRAHRVSSGLPPIG